MLLSKATLINQSLLADYCRSGNEIAIEGYDSDRIKHYRRLVFGIIKDSLETAYPLTQQLLTNTEWESLCYDFFNEHKCQHPQLWRMPEDLCNYVLNHRHPLTERFPFLTDLLLMEWIEIEIYMHKDIETDFRKGNSPSPGKLVINPVSKVQHFNYPVHLKNASTITKQDYGNYFLSMHRELSNFKVIFTSISPLHARLLEILKQKRLSIQTISGILSTEFNIGNESQVQLNLKQFVANSIASGLILGYS